tara:strand:- start:507 stop:620 length:114 start_codon:yes stop_codon:yes gene_type:complete
MDAHVKNAKRRRSNEKVEEPYKERKISFHYTRNEWIL